MFSLFQNTVFHLFQLVGLGVNIHPLSLSSCSILNIDHHYKNRNLVLGTIIIYAFLPIFILMFLPTPFILIQNVWTELVFLLMLLMFCYFLIFIDIIVLSVAWVQNFKVALIPLISMTFAFNLWPIKPLKSLLYFFFFLISLALLVWVS